MSTAKPYTTSSPRLYPQFIVAQHGDAWTVGAFMMAAYPSEGSGWIAYETGELSGQYLIAGPAADLLYLCLCGHPFGSPGSDARPSIARAARAHLTAIAPQPGGYWLAHRVVMHWGEQIWPEMIRPHSERITL